MTSVAIDDLVVATGKNVLHAAMRAGICACDIIDSLIPESAAVSGWRKFAPAWFTAKMARRNDY